MKILLTGATSFTGRHFTNALLNSGHEVHITIRRKKANYDRDRANFFTEIESRAILHENIRHDDESLAELVANCRPDVLHIHAHPMDGFRNADYNYTDAVREMTVKLSSQLEALASVDSARVIYSGSYYEPSALCRPDSHAAVSPYGLSKNIVAETLRMLAGQLDMPVRKFVIPNPFGPGEVGRFGNYLVSEWASNRVPVVRTPRYYRDNIPVQELALRYVEFLTSESREQYEELYPSGYQESQINFAYRVAAEFGSRLGKNLRVNHLEQVVADEPLVLMNDGGHSNVFEDFEPQYWSEYFAYHAPLLSGAIAEN